MTGPNSGLRAQGLRKTFATPGQSQIGGVFDVSLEIGESEGFSLLGPSGCGKTTTLRMLGGFERPETGKIFHRGVDITALPPQKRNIRTVFQRYALFPHLSVFDNIGFGLCMQRRPSAEIKQRVRKMAELIEITHLLERRIFKLSGGEQQRVALARALVTEPSVLLLDEPLSALDLKLRERMQLELLGLRHKLGSTFVFVTHDQHEAMVLSDRIAVMNAGKLEQIGSPEEIYSRPRSRFVASFIGQANFLGETQAALLSGSVGQLPVRGATSDWMVRPESLVPREVTATLAAGWVGFRARLVESAFTGQDRLAKVVDLSGHTYLVKTPGFEPPVGEVGKEILVSWETEDTWAVAN